MDNTLVYAVPHIPGNVTDLICGKPDLAAKVTKVVCWLKAPIQPPDSDDESTAEIKHPQAIGGLKDLRSHDIYV